MSVAVIQIPQDNRNAAHLLFISSMEESGSAHHRAPSPRAGYTILNERLGMFSKAARSRAQAKVSLNDSASLRLKVKRQSFPLRSQRREKRAEPTEAKVRFWSYGSSIFAQASFKPGPRVPKLPFSTTLNMCVLEKLNPQKYGCKRTQTLSVVDSAATGGQSDLCSTPQQKPLN